MKEQKFGLGGLDWSDRFEELDQEELERVGWEAYWGAIVYRLEAVKSGKRWVLDGLVTTIDSPNVVSCVADIQPGIEAIVVGQYEVDEDGEYGWVKVGVMQVVSDGGGWVGIQMEMVEDVMIVDQGYFYKLLW